MGYKGDDFWAVFGCYDCHSVIDGRKSYNWEKGEKEQLLIDALYATFKTWYSLQLL
jgi:hypothetical protein